jgi:hypothetical protein
MYFLVVLALELFFKAYLSMRGIPKDAYQTRHPAQCAGPLRDVRKAGNADHRMICPIMSKNFTQ